VFLTDELECEAIQEQNEYHGIRVHFFGELAKARAKMQIDIGFGDVVYPDPVSLEYPTILEMPQPIIYGYTPESVIAEKLHAIVRHGSRNSRIKDFYDIWFLSRQFNFDKAQLMEAISNTFNNRDMPLIELKRLGLKQK